MYDLNNIDGKEYVSAGKAKDSNSLSTHAKCLNIFVVSTFMLISEIASWFYHLIFPRAPENIAKQLALVTGGGNGLGREFCMRLAKEKCDIAVVDIDLQSAQNTAKDIEEKFGVKSRAFKCDISNYSAVLELKNKIESEMKTVDILVNNAGLLYMADFVTSDMKDIQRTVDVNLTSQFMTLRTFLPPMIKQKRGKILSVCSVGALNPFPLGVVYSATKYAVNGLMDCLHDELSLKDREEFVKFTTVFPDFMYTRKELSDTLDTLDYMFPRLTPERVADESVQGMLTGKRKVTICDIQLIYFLMRQYPDRVRKMILKVSSNAKSLIK